MEHAKQFYINGEWVQPSTSDVLDVINPATEEPICQVAMGGKADVDKAVAAAKAAFETFSQTTVEERIALLGRIIAAYQERMGDFRAQLAALALGLATVVGLPLGVVIFAVVGFIILGIANYLSPDKMINFL